MAPPVRVELTADARRVFASTAPGLYRELIQVAAIAVAHAEHVAGRLIREEPG